MLMPISKMGGNKWRSFRRKLNDKVVLVIFLAAVCSFLATAMYLSFAVGKLPTKSSRKLEVSDISEKSLHRRTSMIPATRKSKIGRKSPSENEQHAEMVSMKRNEETQSVQSKPESPSGNRQSVEVTPPERQEETQLESKIQQGNRQPEKTTSDSKSAQPQSKSLPDNRQPIEETSLKKQEAKEREQKSPPNKRQPVEHASLERKEETQSAHFEKDESNVHDTPTDTSSIAGLSCNDHGGPSNRMAEEMVYWQDIPSDNLNVFPFRQSTSEKYLTFEPDMGGFNNVRMAMETVLALAFAMGRTLVLPPTQSIYLLNEKQRDGGEQNGQPPQFSFIKFFDLQSIAAENEGLEIITTEEFLQRQVRKAADGSNAGDKAVPRQLWAESNRTNWDGQHKEWFQMVRKNAKNLIWDPHQCIAYFPASPQQDIREVENRYQEIVNKTTHRAKESGFDKSEAWRLFVEKPQPLNASESDRMEEFYADRQTLCLYDSQLQAEPLLHFPLTKVEGQNEVGREKWDPRLLVHFYAFLFFADYHQDLWMKRFVRDHVRYTDEIQCAAARVVAELRHHIRAVHGRTNGRFHSMHVRRGDFQFVEAHVSAEELLNRTQSQFRKGDIVYVATDERDKSFFKPLQDHYILYFLDDFILSTQKRETGVTPVLGQEVDSNFYGMIDQLVASRGEVFFGCWFSTFTAYINRLRGYHSQKNREPGYEDGKLMTSFYYTPVDRLDHMLRYFPIKQSFYAREFPTAWRMIDYDVAEK